MAGMDKARALEKMKKCLTLSQSSNAHEAEPALRQPRKLTDEFHLDYSDDEASRAEEHEFKMARSKINLAEIAAIIAGEEQGNKVSLHMPMGRDEKQFLIE